MLAHAIGLGLYGTEGCVQMLIQKNQWEGLGYVVESGMESGNFVKGKPVIISRPKVIVQILLQTVIRENKKLLIRKFLKNEKIRLDWIANSIYNDITIEVLPEHIVVICLNDQEKMRKYLPHSREEFIERGIPSSIPRLGDESLLRCRTWSSNTFNCFSSEGE